ncbi:MAG: hypothetical protein CVV41_05835 [Candidatus Riflebacteria bacterium HGW-Riflebacteria-1]|jgi:excisionase family DNA binding protein|nr:MAG: hypothetical protein CVV41_05835 [Candidatus Riflebacteria bacterium HGW-Riflebacteria-1]
MSGKQTKLTVYYGALVATKKWLTRQEAADYLGVSPSMIDRQLRHAIPTYLISPGGRAFVFKREEIDAWIETNRVGPDEEFFI